MEIAHNRSKLVTVFGGSGFVGRHTVRALAKWGYRVRAAERRPDLAGHLQPMGAVGQIHAVQANLRYPQSVRRAIEGADAVVNLVAILAEHGESTFEALHFEGARTVAEAAREAEVDSLVHISAIGADPSATSHYAQSKGRGERAVLEAFPDAVVHRPSLIFGPEDQLFNRFGAMAQISPVLPLIGGGKTRFQPVYVGDVAEAIARAVDGQAKAGTIYELGGPEVVTFKQILSLVRDYTDRRPLLLPVPFWLAKLMAVLTKPLPFRPLTVDQVRLLAVDNVVSEAARHDGRTLAGLSIKHPTPIAAVVPGYLERFKPNGQYAHYRT